MYERTRCEAHFANLSASFFDFACWSTVIIEAAKNLIKKK